MRVQPEVGQRPFPTWAGWNQSTEPAYLQGHGGMHSDAYSWHKAHHHHVSEQEADSRLHSSLQARSHQGTQHGCASIHPSMSELCQPRKLPAFLNNCQSQAAPPPYVSYSHTLHIQWVPHTHPGFVTGTVFPDPRSTRLPLIESLRLVLRLMPHGTGPLISTPEPALKA